jgi:dipeptidyl aminopeptidase/acylaminoacyl peptidase
MTNSEQQKSVIAYGLWPSPLSPLAASRDLKFSDVAWDEDGALVWLERRPERAALVVDRLDGQAGRDLNSAFSARGGLGYGGGDFTVGRGQVYFVDSLSGRIFRQPTAGGAAPMPVTPAFGGCAAPALSPDGRWLLFIRSYEGHDSLEIVDSAGHFWPQKLAAGDDFYMQPAWSPDGESIAWVSWNHPNMPWDGTQLFLARLAFGAAGLPQAVETRRIAGDQDTSIFQPQFSPDGRSLAYVSDADGWWQIMLHDLASGQARRLTQAPAEHAEPAWIQGRRTFGFAPDGRRIFFLRNQDTRVSLWQSDLGSGEERHLELGAEYGYLEQIAVSAAGIAVIASGSATPPRLVLRALPDASAAARPVQIVRRSSAEEFPAQVYSHPEPVAWTGASGQAVYGLFYPPCSRVAAGQGLPPLIVNVHGGPTGQALPGFDPEVQFFTSRGYALLEVNFRGSSGYGRAYRNLLRGSWGVCDVEDALDGGRVLAEAGRVDGRKLVIMGGSSGGFTVLKALEDHPGVFKAGICRYGVANQFSLALDTHKFELHYADRLIGPLPQAAEDYRRRSPVFFADRIRDALAMFHGEEDAVVPRSQSDAVAAALRRSGTPHIYHVYPGEGHGFRRSETLEHYYRTVERFLLEHVIWG